MITELKDTRLTTCIVSLIGSSSPVGNCNHEAADTRVVVHVLHALEHGADTNVIVILVGQCRSFLPAQPLTDICLAFGMEWARITGSITSTPSVQVYDSQGHGHCQCSMRVAVVTRRLHSMVRARSQLGRLGRHMKMTQKHLSTWPIIHCF